ncbi:MAG: FlxA-like family protein [Lachnospiraceae bacterium]|nr:FlxA-like family protein [Lachnospiraceae bacterium]
MKVNGITGMNTQIGQMGMSKGADSYSKNIQNQIAGAQNQLRELSSNKEMSLEEKVKKRQEIQKQIADLNNQLRQHQVEQRKQKQQEKKSSMDDMLGAGNTRKAKAGKKGRGLSQASMRALISAGGALSQAQSGEQITTQISGQANVLKSEIHLDKQAGLDTAAKEEELAKVEENLAGATASQIENLGKANEEIKEASRENEETEETGKEKKDKSVKGKEETVSPASAADTREVENSIVSQPAPSSYRHVDVLL